MKVKELIRQLQNYDQDKEIKVVAQNGLHLPARVTIMLKDGYDVFNHSDENTEYLILTW